SPGICLYILGAVAFSFFLYLTIFFYLYSTRIEKSMANPETTSPDRPEKKKIAENDAQLWLGKLDRVIAEKTLYKDPNLKLGSLAREINISTHLLSQLLNENLGKSFSTYINEYRIGEACRLIGNNGHLSFEAIGYEVGYNSKSTFYAAFRKIKDTTPALYKESIEKMSHE
ncbi:MAG TPA: helix-turn-helix domain-containing protein, partial [Chitinophagaceae bacterium]|nr:helix-turn-helix domain-containing protein [Chitinophagaceae bacterium]